MERAGVPVAPFKVADARNLLQIKEIVIDYMRNHGGAVIKYPYSAGG